MRKTDFATMLKNERNKAKTLTENGAIAYETSGKHLLDFNFKLSQYRNLSVEEIKKDFSKVFFENPLIATKFVFYVGDVRGGLGERKIFNACIEWLAENKKDIATSVLWAIPEYTRWDNLCKLVTNPNVGKWALGLISDTLDNDINNMYHNKPITLLAKWMPSINASSKKTVELAKDICYKLRMTPRDYRKMLSALRKYLDIVETKMSANEWENVDYSAVPSQANLKYNSAFLKHDETRRRAYLESLRKGETKINASVAQPHEIVRNYLTDDGGWWYRTDVKSYDETLEQMWKALPNVMVEDSLVVRDGSGSMTCPTGSGKTSCLDVATALAIYCAEHNSDIWKDKFITFSSHPEFVDLSNCNTLHDKLVRCYAEDDCSNTNIEATMELILDTAISNNCIQDEMPKNIIIISDMQFDNTRYHNFHWNKTLFEVISDEYKAHGYLLPKIIFWNVSARNFSTIPMQNNELGLILCSGFSTTNMKMFMSGEINPYKVLLEQINSKRYDAIEESIKQLI